MAVSSLLVAALVDSGRQREPGKEITELFVKSILQGSHRNSKTQFHDVSILK